MVVQDAKDQNMTLEHVFLEHRRCSKTAELFQDLKFSNRTLQIDLCDNIGYWVRNKIILKGSKIDAVSRDCRSCSSVG